ncbi:4-amino-4-deoxy-L-arabinose transferase [Amycolatopsis tolypomycina]|uniref:4-amino-4-deoxy-L-arabinose transferase n=1 Tax=Amycolatopsis tolypomycina TaxID=208445 RepID=A0A1H4JRA6_9PSEU|nr:glycosyltransferase family 39 protein [Amycolatopsis tolypomycina]SEB48142.1 4-amino-4-deoxy-L-arabinose transferase [Amycolatopsis tolypomycina]
MTLTAEVRTGRGERIAVGAVLVVAAVAWSWALGDRTLQPYYAAAVHSMSQSVSAFFFAGFDPAGVVTVDKPPLAFWTQTLGVAVFGFHPWAIALVQAVEGVAAVFVLHRVVRRWAGPSTALLAAGLFALTPVTAAVNRDNLPDTLLVLLLLLAAYCVTRAVAAPRWLLWAGVFVGLGFLTKMLAAWIVLPGLALAYFVAAPGSRGGRLARLAAAGAVTLVVSLSWPVVVSLWPGVRPFVGSTTDGSVWQLAFGYNGLTRLVGGGFGATVGTALGGGPGPLRLFDSEVGGQIAWLLPLALGSLAVAACRARGAVPSAKVGWALWGGWLVVGVAVFSFTGGIFHPYYTAELAPAIAALAAAGLVTAWRWHRSAAAGRFALPAAVAGTAALAYVLLSRTPDWLPWLRFTVLALGLLAVVAALMRASRVAVVTGLAAIVAGPAAFVVETASRPVSVLESADPGAGPSSAAALSTVVAVNTGAAAEAGYIRFMDSAYRLGTGQREVLAYAVAQAPSTAITLAVEGGTYGADPFLLNTEARVAPLGGYLGFDPAPSAAELQTWVSAGKLRFVLLPRVFVEMGHAGAASGAASGAPGDAVELTRRIGWEAKHCRPVPPTRIGPDAATAGLLFDCAGLA